MRELAERVMMDVVLLDFRRCVCRTGLCRCPVWHSATAVKIQTDPTRKSESLFQSLPAK